MFECVINKLLTVDGARNDFIFKALCWGHNNPEVPVTKLAAEIISVLPKLKGERMAASEVKAALESSRKGYNKEFLCIDHFHCNNSENCKFLQSKPVEFEFNKKYLISYAPEDDLEIKIFRENKNTYDFLGKISYKLKELEKSGSRSRFIEEVKALTDIDKNPDILKLRNLIVDNCKIAIEEKEFNDLLLKTKIIEDKEKYEQQLQEQFEDQINNEDMIGLARTYFMLSLGGTPYRALLMWLSHLLTISPMDYSPYIITNGSSGAGKSEETERSLKAIHPDYVINIAGTTKASIKRHGRRDPYYYNCKIINLGDKGGTNDNEETEGIRNIFKQLWSEGEVTFEHASDENQEDVISVTLYGKPAITYTTVSLNKDIDEQETGRGFNFNLVKNKDIIKLHTECIDTHRYKNDPWSIAVREVLPKYEETLRQLSKKFSTADLTQIHIPNDTLNYVRSKLPTRGSNQERLYILTLEISRVVAYLKGVNEVSKDIAIEVYNLISSTTVNTMELSESAKALMNWLITVNNSELNDLKNREDWQLIEEDVFKQSVRYMNRNYDPYNRSSDHKFEVDEFKSFFDSESKVFSRHTFEKAKILNIEGSRLREVLGELVSADILELVRYPKDPANYFVLKDKNHEHQEISKPKLHEKEYFPENKKPHYSLGRTHKEVRGRKIPPVIPGRRLIV